MNTLMMKATFLIIGPAKGKRGQTSFGTVFIAGQTFKDNSQQGYPLLVTAAHVLDSIDGEIAQISLRKKNPDGTYTAYPFKVRIRQGGFPILRTGRIASFPLTPASIVKSYLFDIFVYPGNSGGPVYFSYSGRAMGGGMAMGTFVGILGLVIQSENSAIPAFSDKPMNLGIIVPSHFIKETLSLVAPVMP